VRECPTHWTYARKILPVLCFVMLAAGRTASSQSDQDEPVLLRLPEAFSTAFNQHDGHQPAAIMAEDVDFVTVGLTWLQGRAEVEKYHTRFTLGRFQDISYKILQTHVRLLRPNLVVVRRSWWIEGDKDPDGSTRPKRFGLMTMVAEKRQGRWIVSQVQNTNGPTGGGAAIAPEAEGMKAPIVVPRSE
jgi:uncharacterized protein (TIGR02246 family)